MTPIDEGALQRALGAQEATNTMILERLDRMQRYHDARSDRLEQKVDELTATLHEFQGGKHAMLWVAGTMGAILTLLANWAIAIWGAAPPRNPP